MKTLLCLLLILGLPLCSHAAEGVTVLDAPEWQAMDPAEAAPLAKGWEQRGYRLLHASRYTGTGSAYVVTLHLDSPVDSRSFDQVVDGFCSGLEKSGGKVINQAAVDDMPLAGVRVSFQRAAGGPSAALAYLLFAEQDVYVVSLQGSPDLSRTGPMVTSFLKRLAVDPAVRPGMINNGPPDLPADTSTRDMGVRYFGLAVSRPLGLLLSVGSIVGGVGFIAWALWRSFFPGRNS